MTIEDRLTEALHQVDEYEPSVDLFARFERSLDEDRAFRRRRNAVLAGVLFGLAVVATWIGLSAGRGTAGVLFIDGWRMTVAHLAVAGAFIVALAPNIRRFARSFIDDVFHMSPEVGGRFITVLDIAYYTFFTGLLLIDADSWALAERIVLSSAIDDLAARVGFLLLAMGALHAINIAMLPILGLIHASTVRRDLRRRAGQNAPAESMAAKRADSAARGFAVALVTLAVAVAIGFLLGAPGRLLLESLG